MTIEITILIAIVGCFISLAGWLTAREKKISNDSEWRGRVNTSLQNISDKLDDIKVDFEGFRNTLQDHEKRIAHVEGIAEDNKKNIERLEGRKSV